MTKRGKFLTNSIKVHKCCKEALPGAVPCFLVALQLMCSTSLAYAQSNRSEALSVRDRIYKGVSLQNQKKFQAAIDEYEAALAADPSNALAKENIVSAHIDWGNFYFRQKKYEEAEAEWNTALKLNPYDRNAKRNLGILKTTLARLGASSAAEASSAAANASNAAGQSSSTGNQAGAATKNGSGGSPTAGAGAEAKPSTGESGSGPTILPKGAQRPVEDNTPPPTAVILSPIGKGQSSSNSSSSAALSSESSGAALIKPAQSAASSPSSSMNIFTSTPSQGGTVTTSATAASAAPAPTVTNTNPGNANAAASDSGMSIFVNTPKPVTPPPGASSAPTALTNGPGGNLEDKLEAVELKVYGRSQKELPIFQRLERLEKDTNSRVGSGSIADRLQALFKIYGL